VNGRLNYGTSLLAATNGTSRLYAGDASGKMWAVNPSSFSGTNSLWSYDASSALSDSSYDARTDTIQFGTSAGKLVALNAGPHTTVNTSYPYSLTSDPISSAPLYFNGVLVVGTTKGNLYFLDRNTGSTTAPNGVAVIKQVSFGPDQSISTIGFDPNYYRYMVATSSSGAKDGRLYYFDLVSDPTSSIQ
jgi:outer membrane protein assembly factor BamB